MIRWAREFRLIPVVLIATGCLFALKAIGLLFDGGYTLGQRLAQTDTIVVTTVPANASIPLRPQSSTLEYASVQPVAPRPSWMQEMFNYPDVTGSVAARPASRDTLITGSVAAPKPAAKESAASSPPDTKPAANPAADSKAPISPAPESKAAAGTTISLDSSRPTSAAERALLERLHERRQQLDSRARELDIRESLLKAAEKKLEDRAAELKTSEAKTGPGGGQRKEEAETNRFKGVVTMYETMKPKEAAKIFDRLDIKVLMDVATQINPRRMSEIMAQMTPEAAERLTVEMAARASGTEKSLNPADLPKIDGKPEGN